MPGSGEPIRERALGFRGRRLCLAQATGCLVGLQGGPCPLQRAVHRGLAGLQDARGLRGGEAQHVAQQQHGALPGRQQLDDGQEGQLDALAQLIDGGGVARAAQRPDVEVTALQPYPDEWLRELAGPSDPAAGYELRESVQLAFLTVIQLLPPRQRAVLLLRDVLGFSAAETAQILQASQASVNSALQRARSTLESHQASGRLPQAKAPAPGTDRALADRFTAAWHACDIPALVSVLAEDCLLTMPPAPLAYRGRDAIGAFFATVPAGGDLAAIRLVPAWANGQPAVAAYQRDGAAARAYGIMVLTVHSGLIGEITGFADPSLFPLFGLPQQADWPPGQAS